MDTIPHNKSEDVRRVRLTVDRTDNLLKEESYIKDEKERSKNSTWYVLGSVGEIGFVIAIPIALGVLIGSWLDEKFGMYPKLTLSGIGTGLLLAFLSAYRTIEDIIRAKK